MKRWDVVLEHSTDQKRSVLLISGGNEWSQKKRFNDTEICHQLSEFLGLPFEKVGIKFNPLDFHLREQETLLNQPEGGDVEFSNVSVDKMSSDLTEKAISGADDCLSVANSMSNHTSDNDSIRKVNSLELKTAARGMRLIAPGIFVVMGILLLISALTQNEITYKNLSYIVFVLPVVGVVAAWIGKIYSNFRIEVAQERITVITYLGKYTYNKKLIMCQSDLRIVIHTMGTNPFITTLTLENRGQPDVVISPLKKFDSQKAKKFIEGLINYK